MNPFSSIWDCFFLLLRAPLHEENSFIYSSNVPLREMLESPRMKVQEKVLAEAKAKIEAVRTTYTCSVLATITNINMEGNSKWNHRKEPAEALQDLMWVLSRASGRGSSRIWLQDEGGDAMYYTMQGNSYKRKGTRPINRIRQSIHM